MRPCDSVTGTRWTRCTPLSCLSSPYAAPPLHRDDGLLDAANIGGRLGHHLRLPPGTLGQAHVHAKQVAGKDPRLFPAGAGPHFENAVPVVVRIAGRELFFELDFQFRPLHLELLHLLRQLGIVPLRQQQRPLFQITLHAQQRREQFDRWLETRAAFAISRILRGSITTSGCPSCSLRLSY